MSTTYNSWGSDPNLHRIITKNNQVLVQERPRNNPSVKTVCMELTGLFPTVVAKRYDYNQKPGGYGTEQFPFIIKVTGGNYDFNFDHNYGGYPLTMLAADGARVYLFDYGFGINDLNVHEGDIYFTYDGMRTNSEISQYVYDVAFQIFGVTVSRKIYTFNIDCEDVTANSDYNTAHPEVYRRYDGYKGRSAMVHWPGLHIRREADWRTYINDTYVGKWNPQWRETHINAYLEEEGHSPEDLIPPRIKE